MSPRDQQLRDAARYARHEAQHRPESPARLGWRDLRLIAETNARVLDPRIPCSLTTNTSITQP